MGYQRLNAQHAVVDTVAAGLAKQGCRAQDGTRCMYRASDSAGNVTKCAVGQLIPDALYRVRMEGCGVREAGIINALGQAGTGLELDTGDLMLLESLQLVHDTLLPTEWATGFALIHKQIGREMFISEAAVILERR